jgi:hypothetical protein
MLWYICRKKHTLTQLTFTGNQTTPFGHQWCPSILAGGGGNLITKVGRFEREKAIISLCLDWPPLPPPPVAKILVFLAVV